MATEAVDIHSLAQILKHSNIVITKDYLTQLTPDQVSAEMDKVVLTFDKKDKEEPSGEQPES